MKNILILISLSILSCFAQENIETGTGWKLVGTSLGTTNMQDFNKSSIKVVWTYDENKATWKAYSPDPSVQKQLNDDSRIESLDKLRENEGFWIYSYVNDIISLGSSEDTSAEVVGNNHTLLAWNDLGMHCMDGNDYSVFSILPPYNNLHAQLIDKSGSLVTTGVNITYTAQKDSAGILNTTSSNKTNFWDYVLKLFGASVPKDVGLTGNYTPSTIPRALNFNSTNQWWEAEGIPITPYNDNGGVKNYYPRVEVIAKDLNGNILAKTTTVLPVSDEMDCKACHASTVSSNDAKPNRGWVNHTNSEKDYKLNILRLHDQKYPTAVSENIVALSAKSYNYNTSGLEATVNAGTPILCTACHKSNALPGVGIELKPLTQVLHSSHASVIDPVTNLALNDATNRDACYRCHPGAATECLRGAMGNAKNPDGTSQMDCQSCHGNMTHVGDSNRNGWLEQPDCQSCHQNGQRHTTAIDPLANTLRTAVDQNFATNPNTPAPGLSLYRFSKGHGNLQCESCHGATHAIYPSHEFGDNIQSIAVQGHAGTVSECTACHTTLPLSLNGGPHGMHTIGQSFVDAHGDYVELDPSACKTCHGSDYRGSFLSKVTKDRTFRVDDGATKSYTKGTQVSCYDCHNGPYDD